MCRQFMCPISHIIYVSYMFLKMLEITIKREKKYENKKGHNFITCARLTGICFLALYVISNICSQKYKTHKIYRTHELTTQVS